MPVKIEMSSIEFSAISQMEKDYKVLYEALDVISTMVALTYTPFKMQWIAKSALDKITIIP